MLTSTSNNRCCDRNFVNTCVYIYMYITTNIHISNSGFWFQIEQGLNMVNRLNFLQVEVGRHAPKLPYQPTWGFLKDRVSFMASR